jgi:hypothetical protein
VPDVLYTWDHIIGEPGLGNNVEMWAKNFGDNTIALDNSTDGILTVTESGLDALAGTNWAITDSFNRVKESLNGADAGGLDLTGLDALELDIAHDGPNPIQGRIYAHLTPSSVNTPLGDITIAPGGIQTVSVSLAGLSPLELSTFRTIGIEIFEHAAEGNRVWQISEVRSAGMPLFQRLIADHDDGLTDFDGVITNFEADSVSGHTGGANAKNTTGLTINTVDGALQWLEFANAQGVALEWGGGDNLLQAEDFSARPMDLRQYRFAEARVRALSTVPGEQIGVQFYMQNEGFNYYPAVSDQTLIANATYQTLVFRITNIPNRDQVNIHGLNFHTHTGQVQFRVDYLRYYVPEPSTALLWLVGVVAMLGGVRKRS